MHRVDMVFSRERIDYCAVYGTCLGAVRENGIIPWDDDIDIAVRRSDFIKALEVLTNSSEQIYAGDRTSIPGCPSRCGRIFNRVGSGCSIERKRAYIDLHVIDYAPKTKVRFWWSVLWYVGVSRIVSSRNGVISNGHRGFYAVADCVAFPFRILPTRILSKLADWIYIGKKRSPFIKITFDGNRKRYPATSFSSFKRVPFNEFTIPVPLGYDEYLSVCYGDWRIPPPPEGRFSHAFDRNCREWTVPMPDETVRSLRD